MFLLIGLIVQEVSCLHHSLNKKNRNPIQALCHFFTPLYLHHLLDEPDRLGQSKTVTLVDAVIDEVIQLANVAQPHKLLKIAPMVD